MDSTTANKTIEERIERGMRYTDRDIDETKASIIESFIKTKKHIVHRKPGM